MKKYKNTIVMILLVIAAIIAGYGFICTLNDLIARNRAGKTLISLPDNAHVMPPLVIEDESDMLLAITAAGRMLMFPVSDLPQHRLPVVTANPDHSDNNWIDPHCRTDTPQRRPQTISG